MSVAKWALGAMALIVISQMAIFLAVSHVAHKALDEAKFTGHVLPGEHPQTQQHQQQQQPTAQPTMALAPEQVPLTAPPPEPSVVAIRQALPKFRLERRSLKPLPPLLIPIETRESVTPPSDTPAPAPPPTKIPPVTSPPSPPPSTMTPPPSTPATPRPTPQPPLDASLPIELLDVRSDVHSSAPVLTDDQKRELLYVEEAPRKLTNLRDAALLVLCYDRADYLTETLKSIAAAQLHADIKKYISQDGDEFQTQAVAQSFESSAFEYMSHPRTLPEMLKLNTSDPELMVKATPSTMYLAAHYKWALDKVLFERNHSHVIILEDDMKVTKDFFQFFEMLAPLLDVDPTIWCISSWNDNGFQHLDLSPRRMFRSSHFPGLGWMMKRELWLELREKFPEDNWDHWMRATTTSKQRECVSPYLSRNFNIGVGGATSNKFFYQQYLKTIKVYSGKDAVALGDLSYLLHDEYFALIKELTSEAGPSPDFRKHLQARLGRHDKARASHSSSAASSEMLAMVSNSGAPRVLVAQSVSWKAPSEFAKGQTYIVPYVKEEYETLATQLALHPTPRTHFRHATWLSINGANVFLIDKRRSPFAHAAFRKAPHSTLRAVRAEKPGVSCTIVCENENIKAHQSDATSEYIGWRCAPEQFDFVNDCLVLAKHFDGCPYGCTQGWGEDIPAMEDWGIGHRPQCLTTEVSPTCDAEFAHTQRLCPCIAQHVASHRKSLVAVPAQTVNTNCDDVCGAFDGRDAQGNLVGATTATSWRCDPEQFQFINTCQTLKRNFGCTQCDMNFGADLPNFVVNKKDANSGKCLMMRGDMTCAGAHKNTKRLCPCVPADPQ